LWPAYFDRSLPRRLGRRVPKEFAIENPDVNSILAACRKLGIECRSEDGLYPRTWYRHRGKVIAVFEGKKIVLIKLIAKALLELQGRVPTS